MFTAVINNIQVAGRPIDGHLVTMDSNAVAVLLTLSITLQVVIQKCGLDCKCACEQNRRFSLSPA